MGFRVIVDEHAPEHEPDDRSNTEEVKHVWPTAGYVLYDETAQEVCKNITNLYTREY